MRLQKYFGVLGLLLPSLALAETWVSLGAKSAAVVEAPAVVEVTVRDTSYGKQMVVDIPGLFVDRVQVAARRFSSIRLDGEGFLNDIGRPRIPVIRRLVEVPEGSQVRLAGFSAEYLNYELKTLGLWHPVRPVQESTSKSATETPKFSMDTRYYRDNSFGNFPVARLGDSVKIKGRTYRMVEIFPFQYNPAKNALRVAPHVEIRFAMPHAESTASNPDASRQGLLILAGDEFATNAKFQELVAWKRDLGFAVKVVKVSEAGSSPEAIRGFLIEEYSRWLTPALDYLLIVGDDEFVPAYRGNAYRGPQATDNYYATLDNSDYAADLTSPDVAVGRLPAKNAAELELMIGKILKYEKAEFDSEDWIKRIAFVGTDDRSWYQVAEGTHNYVVENYTGPRGFYGNFPQNPNAGGDKLYAITHSAGTDNLLNAFREGRMIINYSGHGMNYYWAGPDFAEGDLARLDHPDALPYVVSNACLTGTFAESRDSWSEMWVKAAHGAIGFFGASNNSYWDEDDVLEKAMWHHAFADDNLRIGDINFYGKGKVREHYNNGDKTSYYFEMYNLMGDPTVRLYSEMPKDLYVTMPAIPVGRSQFTVEVADDRGGVAKATVHILSADGSVSAIAHSDASGAAEFLVDTANWEPGQYRMVVSAQNHRVLQTELPVIAPSGPYFLVDGYSTEGASGFLRPFADVDLRFRVRNVGVEAAPVSLMPRLLPEGLVVRRAGKLVCSAAPVAPGASVECAETLGVRLNKGVADGVSMRLGVEFSGSEHTNTTVATLNVVNADFALGEMTFDDSDNGFPDPGEDLVLRLPVKNIGRAEGRNVRLEVTAVDGNCFAVSHGIVLPALLPGATVLAAIPAHVSESCVPGDETSLQILVVPQEDPSFSFVRESRKVYVGTRIEKETFVEPALSIPDSSSNGVVSPLEMEGAGTISSIQIYVDIKHTYVGDLVVILVAPDGTEVALHRRKGGGADDLEGWYGDTLVSSEPLTNLVGMPFTGTWQLRISDEASSDVGILRKWGIRVVGLGD